MARPTSGYRNAENKRVPGVTTITGRYKESGGLIHWAWNEGVEGRDYRAARDAAADAGTLAHDAIFAHLHGQPFDWPDTAGEIVGLAYDGFEQYLRWEKQTRVEFVSAEEPIVSEKLQVGGTPDAIGTIEGRSVLLDWKTSNGLYPDYLYQCAAYCLLVEEHYGMAMEEIHILRLGKEDASFHHHSWMVSSDKVQSAMQAFRMMRTLYEIDKQVKRGL